MMKYTILFCFILFQVAVCGQELDRTRRASGLIVNGENAGRGNFPGFAWIYYNDGFYCGGTIVDRRTILTAAHCGSNPAKRYRVAVGKYKFNVDEGTEQYIDVSEITSHESYEFPNDDIALFHLKKDITFNDYVQPATLATKTKMESNKTLCYAVGSGTSKQNSDGSRENPGVLQKLETSFINRKRCRKIIRREMGMPARSITKDVLCTFDENAGVCFGDSGGPVGCYNAEGTFVQYGLLSYGSPFCTDGFNVFTRTSKYRKWITENI